MTNLYNAIMQKRAEFTARMCKAPSVIYLGHKEMPLARTLLRTGMKILKVDVDSHVGVGE